MPGADIGATKMDWPTFIVLITVFLYTLIPSPNSDEIQDTLENNPSPVADRRSPVNFPEEFYSRSD
jgi:hypothetical protein